MSEPSIQSIRRPVSMLLLVGLFLSLTACGQGSEDAAPEVGLSTNACGTIGLNTKIINGTECESVTSPVVDINLYAQNGLVYGCSGTAITDHQILTAAHCLVSKDDDDKIEAISIIKGKKEIFASSAVVPQSYRETPDASFVDVAVIGFEQPLSLPILPIITSQKVVTNDVIAIYGYGEDKQGDSGDLRSGEMLVDAVTSNHIISFFGFFGSNTCFGDSGGPAVIQYTDSQGETVTGVVGVTSSGTPGRNCATGDRSLFTNIQDEPALGFLRRAIPGLRTK